MTATHTVELDLGSGVTLRFTSWKPRNAIDAEDMPETDRIGAIITHPHTRTGEPCMTGVLFNCDAAHTFAPGRPKWDVSSEQPLTIVPSLSCTECGAHGWITDGRWVTAAS